MSWAISAASSRLAGRVAAPAGVAAADQELPLARDINDVLSE